MENTEHFFYITPEMNQYQLKELSKKYNIHSQLLFEIYDNALKSSERITSLKIIPKFKKELKQNVSIIGVEYIPNSSHIYYTLNDFLLIK